MQENIVTNATVFTVLFIISPRRGIIFFDYKYIQSMTDLLFATDNIKTYFYFCEGERLLDIALKLGVPPSILIYDNNLTKEPSKGMVLVVNKRGRISKLSAENFPSGEYADKIKEINKCDYLYPFQPVVLPEDLY